MPGNAYIHQLLNAIEREEHVTLCQIADAMIKRWPGGVIIIAIERRAVCEHPEHAADVPRWSARGRANDLLVALERTKATFYHLTDVSSEPPYEPPPEG